MPYFSTVSIRILIVTHGPQKVLTRHIFESNWFVTPSRAFHCRLDAHGQHRTVSRHCCESIMQLKIPVPHWPDMSQQDQEKYSYLRHE
jgi:hypothetical protein